MEYFLLTIEEIEELERRAEEEILTMEEVDKLLIEIDAIKSRLDKLKAKIKGAYEITEKGLELLIAEEIPVSKIEKILRKIIKEEVKEAIRELRE